MLVDAIFHAPTLMGPTLGSPSHDVRDPSPQVPFPVTAPAPSTPASVRSAGVVVVEVDVDASGSAAGAAVVRSAPGFDDAALQAARAWTFRPAERLGSAIPSRAYLVFGFPLPVTGR